MATTNIFRLYVGLLVVFAFLSNNHAFARIVYKRQSSSNSTLINAACPYGGGSIYTAQNGLTMVLCPNSNFNVGNVALISASSLQNCAEICSTTPGCMDVVYAAGTCSNKGSPTQLNMQKSNYYSTITVPNTTANNQILNPNAALISSACPYGGGSIYTAQNGLTMVLCPNSNFNVGNVALISASSLQNCAEICSTTPGCMDVVYAAGTCSNKGSPTQLNMQQSNYYSTITVPNTTANNQILNPNGALISAACPYGGGSIYTAQNGLTMVLCPNSNFNVGNVALISASSLQNCAEICSTTPGCMDVVYAAGTCSNKGSPTQLNMQQSNYYSTIIVPNTTANNQILNTQTNAALISAACPYGGGSIYTTKGGLVAIMCPNSNFNTGNLAIVSASTMQQCAEICGTTPGCYNVVYAAGSCSIKGAPYQPNMQQSTYYSTITIANTTANNKLLAPLNGQWSSVIPLDVIPVASYMIPAYPTAKEFFTFASWNPDEFGGPNSPSQTAFASYDFTTNTKGEFTVTNTQHDMFCPGMNSLADGRLMVDGGSTSNAVTIYDPFQNTFTAAATMVYGRGYQSSVLLSNGKTFTIGGSWSGGVGGEDGVPMKNGEIYDPVANQWTLLPNALVQPMLTSYDNGGTWRLDNHGWLYAWSGGSVFQAGPSMNMNWYSTSGSGAVQGAGTRNPNNDQMCGVNVMYDNGKIFSAGGAQSYTDNSALSIAHQITLNGVNQTATVQQLPSLNYARSFANALVLPNGQVLIVGGQEYAEVFTDVQSVLQAELYDPVKQTSTIMAPASVPRNYHSSALLLPDGRVMSGGGGLCNYGANCSTSDHQDIQFYTPSYLFDASGNPITNRPTVSSIQSSQQQGSSIKVNPGGTLTVTLNSVSGISHVLMRMGSSTHTVDTDQRRIPLTVAKTSGNTVTLNIPNDNGIVPPGFWYYFAVASSGAHSIGMTVNVLAVN